MNVIQFEPKINVEALRNSRKLAENSRFPYMYCLLQNQRIMGKLKEVTEPLERNFITISKRKALLEPAENSRSLLKNTTHSDLIIP